MDTQAWLCSSDTSFTETRGGGSDWEVRLDFVHLCLKGWHRSWWFKLSVVRKIFFYMFSRYTAFQFYVHMGSRLRKSLIYSCHAPGYLLALPTTKHFPHWNKNLKIPVVQVYAPEIWFCDTYSPEALAHHFLSYCLWFLESSWEVFKVCLAHWDP